MNWTMFIGHGVIATSILLMALSAGLFRLWHKRSARRSPLAGRKSGHLPGQQLLKRIAEHDQELDTAMALMYMAFPFMFLVWLTLHVDWTTVSFGTSELMFSAGAILLFLWGLRDYVRHFRFREQARDGWRAENVTGLQLNRLIAQGCVVMHDLPSEYGNIDHVVVAPRAVFAIETKSFRKPKQVSDKAGDPSHQVTFDGKSLRFPDFSTTAPLEQATRQANWLKRTIRDALGRDIPVVPVVALPGWYVNRTEEAKRADIQVLSPMGKGADILAREPERIPQAERRLIAEALAIRYPEIPQ